MPLMPLVPLMPAGGGGSGGGGGGGGGGGDGGGGGGGGGGAFAAGTGSLSDWEIPPPRVRDAQEMVTMDRTLPTGQRGLPAALRCRLCSRWLCCCVPLCDEGRRRQAQAR